MNLSCPLPIPGRLAVAAALALVVASGAHGAALPGATIDSVRAWLVEHNPELQALDAEAAAAAAEAGAAGALPDPSFALTLPGLDPHRPLRLPGEASGVDYAVRQRLPLWGKRGLSRSVADAEASARHADAAARLRELTAAAAANWLTYWHAEQALAVLERRRALVEQMEAIAAARYALGAAAQQDAIRAQVEGTRLARERLELEARHARAAAALNGALGRAPGAELAPPEAAPALTPRSADLTVLLARLDAAHHPALQAASTRLTAAGAARRLERRRRFPDLTVGLGVMQRHGSLRSHELMLEVEIPFQQRARRSREEASRWREEAARARFEAARDALAAEARAAWSDWTHARARRELTERTLLPQADAVFHAALASYQVGRVDFATLLEALTQWQGADRDRLDAWRDELLAVTTLHALEGATP